MLNTWAFPQREPAEDLEQGRKLVWLSLLLCGGHVEGPEGSQKPRAEALAVIKGTGVAVTGMRKD